MSAKRERIMPAGHWDWSMPTPLSQGWKAGDFLYVGGQISADENGRVVAEDDIATQTRNVFEGITTVLREGGCTWADVIKLNTYYVFDGADDELTEYWENMTRVRMEYLADPGPAATAVRVAGLVYPGLLIEADAVALLR
jgi:enamine deaminase RidA (YjgF/YER057c/UK114 family)